ncbi:Trp biosynthesis-associated membrane protein [Leifsonia shinshuensis]|uniref:Trp biosynthesis-associated membrane protein n=1 Tax=Leifsonia shinshuensis TaxID=150026 RepID=UPI001F514FC8|nr:Trp biosynthesis-associated membrane protein [Leifsonia shinshuensis]MCI0155659.1 Trp biosynthesis-associated membrane protein [Leifsonia shinshuensis]
MRTENRRVKYLTLLALVVGSGLGLLSATQTWFVIGVTDVADHAGTVTVAGSAAAPALTALSLAGLALTAALAIAGPAFRVVLSILGVLLGVSIVYSAVSVLGDPLRAAGGAITSATGVAGENSLRKLVESTTTEFWPWLAVIGGVLVALAGVAAVVFVRAWPGPSRRYQTRFAGEDGRSAEEAVAELGGEDRDEAAAAADGSDHGEAPAAAEGDTPDAPAALDRDTAIDSWDELSRGDDPTR